MVGLGPKLSLFENIDIIVGLYLVITRGGVESNRTNFELIFIEFFEFFSPFESIES